MAMPIPLKTAVNNKRKGKVATKRNAVDTPINKIDNAIVSSMPHRALNFPASGAKSPIQKTGKAVSKLTTTLDICKSAWIFFSTGEMDVMEARRFIESMNKEKTLQIIYRFFDFAIIESTPLFVNIDDYLIYYN